MICVIFWQFDILTDQNKLLITKSKFYKLLIQQSES